MVPAYWIVSSDVRRARAHLNFSEIAALPEEQQRLALFDAFDQIQLGRDATSFLSNGASELCGYS
jgi:hypothetical protein